MTEKNILEFTKMHDEFLSDWNKAMISGNTSSLDRMTEEYYVAFFKEASDKPVIFTKQDCFPIACKKNAVFPIHSECFSDEKDLPPVRNISVFCKPLLRPFEPLCPGIQLQPWYHL